VIWLDLGPGERAHLAVAILDRARELRRNGSQLPPRLERLAVDLLRDPERDVAARRRALSAARSRRYRARKRERAAAASAAAGLCAILAVHGCSVSGSPLGAARRSFRRRAALAVR
jgi:hypothetical protein